MDTKLLKYIPFTTAILLYLYCCGSLYLVGYWEIFNVDVTGFISITEIPKFFVFPFFISNVFFLIIAVIIFFILRFKPLDKALNKSINMGKSGFTVYQIISAYDIIFIVILILAYYMYPTFKMNVSYWVTNSVIMTYLISAELGKSNLLSSIIQSGLWRTYIFAIILGGLVFSFTTGKVMSLSVYSNRNIKCVNILNNKNTTASQNRNCLKLIGLLSDNAIIGTLNNDSIIIVNQSVIEQIQISNTAK